MERITVGLIDQASNALAVLVERTGYSKTDVVNRALQLYRLVHDETAAGRRLALIDSEGNVESVRLL